MSIVRRFREIGLTSQIFRDMSPRHAALRDDPLALAIRCFRDRNVLPAAESAALFADYEPPPYPALDIVEDLYLFSDPDEILGPGETTAILYRAARQVHAATIFDLGCGCGTLSLVLACAVHSATYDRAARTGRQTDWRTSPRSARVRTS